MTIELATDNYLLVLELCACRGNPECSNCYGSGGPVLVDSVDLGVLLANLAIAGALTRAHNLGYVRSLGAAP